MSNFEERKLYSEGGVKMESKVVKRTRQYSINGAKRDKYLEILELNRKGYNQNQIHNITRVNRYTVKRISEEYKLMQEIDVKVQRVE